LQRKQEALKQETSTIPNVNTKISQTSKVSGFTAHDEDKDSTGDSGEPPVNKESSSSMVVVGGVIGIMALAGALVFALVRSRR